MKTLKNIFASSRFYKEARMVSFLDHLLQTITAKIKKRVNLAKALSEASTGHRSAESFITNQIGAANESVQKFEEGFFINDLMQQKDSVSKVAEALGHSVPEENEEVKGEEEEKKGPRNQFEQSFYRQQGIDFLNFQRPGTAYGSAAFQQAAANSTSTSFYSKAQLIKPAALPTKA